MKGQNTQELYEFSYSAKVKTEKPLLKLSYQSY